MKKNISSDLKYALEYNEASFNLEDIISVEAEIPGENDESDWYWIIRVKGKGYLLLEGGCDYTGWDCQSSIEELGFFKTKLQAANAAPEKKYSRVIRADLVKQVKTGSSFIPEMKDYR